MSTIDRYTIESLEKWREWAGKIPAVSFDSDWKIKVIPPFGGAMARFVVYRGEKKASVYLDCNNALGYMENPYWEVYPVKGDAARCGMHDTDELVLLIRQSLDA
jgi:hypothetical protein